MVAAPRLEDAAHERQLLGALARAAERAARHETKIAALARLLRRVNEPAIVFTEYRDTLLHLQASLGFPSVTLHGGMTRDERLEAISHFTHGGGRLLLATDAAGEGLNLQQTCRLVVNLELPWNPMRLEQRIGRVDRIGQRRAVHVFHLIARDSGESRVLVPASICASHERALTSAGRSARDPSSSRSRRRGPLDRPARRDSTSPGTRAIWTPFASNAWRPPRPEAGRITRARHAGVDEPATTRRSPGSRRMGPAVAAARHWQTRAALGGRALMLWRIAAEDGSGPSRWRRPSWPSPSTSGVVTTTKSC